MEIDFIVIPGQQNQCEDNKKCARRACAAVARLVAMVEWIGVGKVKGVVPEEGIIGAHTREEL
jgi:hypothetical protein